MTIHDRAGERVAIREYIGRVRHAESDGTLVVMTARRFAMYRKDLIMNTLHCLLIYS